MLCPIYVVLCTVLLLSSANAQFQFFEQMFQGGQQEPQPQNVASDSSWYQQNYESDKVELGEGSAVCVSKGGYSVGETSKKIELARKGLL
ncbi:MAG: Long chronological lifespan protein 2 [Chaenotheca gracillima]|nr:MAG: Long chronological lifespan protein 2 [Chaenotheca gracillima]